MMKGVKYTFKKSIISKKYTKFNLLLIKLGEFRN